MGLISSFVNPCHLFFAHWKSLVSLWPCLPNPALLSWFALSPHPLFFFFSYHSLWNWAYRNYICSSRHAIQLLSPASIVAKTNGRDKICKACWLSLSLSLNTVSVSLMWHLFGEIKYHWFTCDFRRLILMK